MRLQMLEYPESNFSANTYLLIDDLNNVIVIDPGFPGSDLTNQLLAQGMNVKAILLTHTHYDHMRGVIPLVEAFKCPVYAHHLDVLLFENENFHKFYTDADNLKLPNNIITVENDETLTILNMEIKVIHTPFHTRGSVLYVIPALNSVFSGDTLFKGSIGRLDLFGSAPLELTSSLETIKKLPKSFNVFPGHGDATTIEAELKSNPYLGGSYI